MNTNKHEIKLRKRCIELHKSGKSPTDISGELKRSRPWTYKWIKRYKSGKEKWYEDESKAPKLKPTKLTPELESEIIEIRN
jgi:transposase